MILPSWQGLLCIVDTFISLSRPISFPIVACIRGSQRERWRLPEPWLTNSALVYEPKYEGGGVWLRGLSQWEQLCTWNPNKFWRSTNSIFNLYGLTLSIFLHLRRYINYTPPPPSRSSHPSPSPSPSLSPPSTFLCLCRFYTVIRFVSISAKFGIFTVVGLNETLVAAKICIFKCSKCVF